MKKSRKEQLLELQTRSLGLIDQYEDDLSKYDKSKEETQELARLLGVPSDGLNYHNARSAVSKAVKELVELREKAEAHGTTLGRVLEGYCRQKPTVELNPIYSSAPPHWVTEGYYRKESLSVNGLTTTRNRWVGGTTPAQAQGKLKALRPLLVELHEKAKDEPDFLGLVLEMYQWAEYEDFYSEVLSALYAENGGTLEESDKTPTGSTQTDQEVLEATWDLLVPDYGVVSPCSALSR